MKSAILCFLFACLSLVYSQNYIIGVGIGDVTGPAADVNLMGYAHPGQTSRGLHLRQYSRAYIVCDPTDTDCNVYVIVDNGMGGSAINLAVIQRLKTMYGDMYSEKNVAIAGTHTHSGLAGYLQYFLFTATSQGFVQDVFDVYVEGIFQSIRQAHESKQAGDIYWNKGELLEANINRSPYAYEANPAAERQRYSYDVDKDMTVLKFVNSANEDLGLLSFFPVHPVSMNNTNRLLSGDNKGYASYLLEMEWNSGSLYKDITNGDKFIAGFANANQGDVSPNTLGAFCMDTGEPCDRITSTCNGRTSLCRGVGPGKDMFEATKIVGEKQADKAKELYNTATVKLEGPISFVHQFVDMSNYEVDLEDGTTGKTCKHAMGYSFAAGATDGAGFYPFEQSTLESMPYLDALRDAVLKMPSPEVAECQQPKPILLATGEMQTPWEWAPSIVDLQLMRFGQFVMILVPSELSTMAGRRLRDTVSTALQDNGVTAEVEIAGLSNTYSDYVVTFEEYQVQRYEGASTPYGQYTLQAYQQAFAALAKNLAEGTQPVQNEMMPNLMADQGSTLSEPEGDVGDINRVTGLGRDIGEVYMDADRTYRQGSVAQAAFVAGNPRNDAFRMRDETFLVVEKRVNPSRWDVVYTDADWCTRFYWDRVEETRRGTVSVATVYWEIPEDQQAGVYRIGHKGYWKDQVKGDVKCYGLSYSSTFEVVSKDYQEDRSI